MSKKSSISSSSDPLRLIGRVSSIASFGLFVILAANYVDARIKNAQEVRIQEELVAETSLQQVQLEKFKAEATKWDQDLDLWNERAITEEEIAGIQNELIELAKKHSCTLKKVSQRGVFVRPLIEKNPTNSGETREEVSGLPNGQKEFEVHEVGLTLSSEGDFQNTLRLLDAIKNSNWITSTHQLVLRRDPAQASMLVMDLEINFASLKLKSDKNL
jgi:hypothetical protein